MSMKKLAEAHKASKQLSLLAKLDLSRSANTSARSKTAFSLEDIKDAIYAAPGMASDAYYDIKDRAYGYGDTLGDKARIIGSRLNRGLRDYVVDPVMNIERSDLFY
jgi:hypothetical protein